MSIQNLITLAKSKGLQVYAPSNLTSYIYITDGLRVGYCQFNRAEGESFSTVHKPCKEYGTGFRVESIDNVFMIKPHWVIGSSPINKYKSFSDFLANHWNKLIEY